METRPLCDAEDVTLWRECAAQLRHFKRRGRGLVAQQDLAAGQEVFQDTPLVALQHLFSQRLTPCCAACMTPVGSFSLLLQRILRNSGQTLESFPVASHELMGHHLLAGIEPVLCPSEGCKALFCSESCREEELSYGAHRLLCRDLREAEAVRCWAEFKALARRHHENLLLAARALAWAVCQVKHRNVPEGRVLAELLTCQNERWDRLPRCPHRQRERLRVVQASLTLLRRVLGAGELLSEDVYSRLLGEFDLVNVSIEFGHPFQAALGSPELQPLAAELRSCGLLRRLAEVAGCHDEANGVAADLVEELPAILGIGLARRVAMMNHSCRPACEVEFGDGCATAVVRALRKISAGEELTISYIDESQPVRKRQRSLWLRYGFRCLCSRCARELREARLSSGFRRWHPMKCLQKSLAATFALPKRRCGWPCRQLCST
ncbi:unnamed protein product [Effrenium voratum]|nr:unnamed protein product [Effrenium voratum]